MQMTRIQNNLIYFAAIHRIQIMSDNNRLVSKRLSFPKRMKARERRKYPERPTLTPKGLLRIDTILTKALRKYWNIPSEELRFVDGGILDAEVPDFKDITRGVEFVTEPSKIKGVAFSGEDIFVAQEFQKYATRYPKLGLKHSVRENNRSEWTEGSKILEKLKEVQWT